MSINKEIEQLENYLHLHEMHLEGRGKVSFTSDIEGTGFQIAPLLLMVFIENAFKHGMRGDGNRSFVDIHMAIEGMLLRFRIRNSKGAADRPEPEQPQGIGIKNTRKRLELLYAGKHELEIKSMEDTYTVNLSIKLKHYDGQLYDRR